MRPKRHFTPQQKVAILREYLKNKTSISEIAKKHDIHPNMIYLWEKSLFEGALDTFSRSSSKQSSSQDKKISELEEKLRKRNAVISELIEDNILLKKNLGEI